MIRLAIALMGIIFVLGNGYGAIVVSGSTLFWTGITNPETISDSPTDNQANVSDLEMIGDADNESFYSQFDDFGTPSLTDGELAFRFRMSGNQGNQKFHGYAWVGLDVNMDGTLDLFLGASDRTIGIYEVESGTGSTPGNTGIGDALWTTRTTRDNYDWSPVTTSNDPDATSLDLDNAAGNDYFLSFVLPFDEVVSAVNAFTGTSSFDESSVLRYVGATSTNKNRINSDINGLEGGTGSNVPWEENNGFTPEVTVDGTPIPEPSLISLAFGIVAIGAICIKRRIRPLA